MRALRTIASPRVIPNQKFQAVDLQAGVRRDMKKFFHRMNSSGEQRLLYGAGVRVEAARISALRPGNAARHKSRYHKQKNRA